MNVLNDRIFKLVNKENNETKKEGKNIITKKHELADYSWSPKHLNQNRSIHLSDFDTNTPIIVDKASLTENKPKQ